MRSSAAEAVRVGVCGFCLPQAKLFAKFKLLEVQQTFYWPPQLKTVERWRQSAPADFEFTVKAFQAITHTYNPRTYRKAKFSEAELGECGGFRDNKVVRTAWALTLSLAAALEATAAVFQCPPSFDASDENVRRLRAFFEWAKRGGMRFVWEPRHATWTPELISQLCRDMDLIHAVDAFEQESVAGTPRYFRLHGKALGKFRYDYDHPYSDEELKTLLERCQSAPTFCLFNNIQMAADAEQFEMMQERLKRTR